MLKLNPDELRQISERKLMTFVNWPSRSLANNPQVSRPLTEARDAAKAKYETVSEHRNS